MGLTVAVGMLAQDKAELDPDEFEDFRKPYDKLNDLLRQCGLPAHVEPEELPEEAIYEGAMIGYGGLHSLRRLAAHWSLHGSLPEPDRGQPAAENDPSVAQLYSVFERSDFRSRRKGILDRILGRRPMFPHLLLHSDAEGFYVPLEFDDVLFEAGADPNSGLGGMVGSSVRLLEECETLAGLIDLPPDIDPEDDRLIETIDEAPADGPLWRQYGREAFGLARLITACRLSVTHKACVVFC
jgi:hypothetical protein